MKKILILLLSLISLSGFSQIIRTTDNKDWQIAKYRLTVGDSTVTKIMEDTLVNPLYVREKIAEYALNDTSGVTADSAVWADSSGHSINSDTALYSINSDSTWRSINVHYIDFDTTDGTGLTNQKGRLFWTNIDGTLGIMNGDGSVTSIGQEENFPVQNVSGTDIHNGDPVYFIGSGAEQVRVGLATNLNAHKAYLCMGLATTDILSGDSGRVCTFGKVHDLNTNAGNENLPVWLGNGVVTYTKPTTGHIIEIGKVLRKHNNQGIIYVDIHHLSESEFSILNNVGNDGTYLDTSYVQSETGKFNVLTVGNSEPIDTLYNINTTTFDTLRSHVGRFDNIRIGIGQDTLKVDTNEFTFKNYENSDTIIVSFKDGTIGLYKLNGNGLGAGFQVYEEGNSIRSEMISYKSTVGIVDSNFVFNNIDTLKCDSAIANFKELNVLGIADDKVTISSEGFEIKNNYGNNNLSSVIDSTLVLYSEGDTAVRLNHKALKLYNEATVFEDLNFGVVRSGGPAASLPDDVTINNVYYKEFTSANNQNCGDAKEIPHHAKLTQNYNPHAHIFLKNGESAGTTGVTFTLYWELRQSTGTTNGSLTMSATSAQLTANPHKYNITGTAFTGATELGAQLALRLSRTGGDAGDVIVTTYGIHYELDALGSNTISSKE